MNLNTGQKLNIVLNYYVHRYGYLIHTFIFGYLLYCNGVYMNNSLWYVYMINYLAASYFIYIQGVSFGIKQTLIFNGNIPNKEE